MIKELDPENKEAWKKAKREKKLLLDCQIYPIFWSPGYVLEITAFSGEEDLTDAVFTWEVVNDERRCKVREVEERKDGSYDYVKGKDINPTRCFTEKVESIEEAMKRLEEIVKEVEKRREMVRRKGEIHKVFLI